MQRTFSTLVLSACVFTTLWAAAGTITQTASRNGNDYIDWGQLGTTFTVIPSPAPVVSHFGLNASVSNATGEFWTNQQGHPYLGNFAPGDHLIGSGQITPAGNMLITFAKPVFSVGTQMGMDVISDTPVPFTENMVLFDSGHNVLAVFTAQGFMDNQGDNSAVWIGASDSVAEIASAEFFITNGVGQFFDAYALNRLEITNGAVPEPSSLILLGSGVLGLAGMTRRKTSR